MHFKIIFFKNACKNNIGHGEPKSAQNDSKWTFRLFVVLFAHLSWTYKVSDLSIYFDRTSCQTGKKSKNSPSV